jgi:hypothetical protein
MASVASAKASVLAAHAVGLAAKKGEDMYHKGAKIGILAAKAIEQTGEHGSVFALGEHIDVDLITWMMVGLIVFTILFEVAIEKLEHYLSSNEVYMECLRKVFAELTIMGFISFILLLIHEFVHIPFHEHLVFEFAHIWIFFVALVFIFQSIIFMGSLSSSEKKFKVYENSSAHEDMVMSPPSFKSTLLGNTEKEAVLNYHIGKEIFVRHNDLKPTFDFRKYLSSYCGETVVELLDTTPLTWGLLIILFLLNLGRNHLVDYMNHTTEDSAAEIAAADKANNNAAASLLALSELPHHHHISFFQLSVNQVEALLGTHKRSLWTFMTFGWILLISNVLCLIGARYITNKLLFEARFHVGRPKGEEPDAHAHDLADGAKGEALMRSYLPCGKMKVFNVCLELIIMTQCFYLGLMCLLNGRAAYTHFPPPYGFLFLVVMFVPIAINLFVCFPAQIKAIAFLSAITEGNAHLKHEVEEYQEAMMIDFHHKIKAWLKKEKKTPEAGASEIFAACATVADSKRGAEPTPLLHAFVNAGIKFKDDQYFTVFKHMDVEDHGSVSEACLKEEFSHAVHGKDEEH